VKGKTVLIIIGILVGLCVCISACGLIAITQAGRIISSVATTDPIKAAGVAQGIVDYTLPEGYKEDTSVNILGMSMVLINSADGKQSFFLFQAPAGVQISKDQIEQQFRQLSKQSGDSSTTLNPIGTRTVTIRGQSAEIAIYESTSSSGSTLHEEIGEFQGKNGPAFLMMMAPTDSWDQAAVDAFIQSMK
jgi:hypothetical protein